MNHLVLGIGYEESEYLRTQKEWKKYDVDIHLVRSIDEAFKELSEHNIICVIIHSNSHKFWEYVDIIRMTNSVPIVVIPSECSIEEREAFINMGAAQYILENGKREIATRSGLDNIDFYLRLEDKSTRPLTIIIEKDLFFCLEYRTVKVKDQNIELSPLEFDALHLFLKNKKRVLTFEIISECVWGEEYIDTHPKNVNNLISRLRSKLKSTQDVPDYIQSIRGIGYKFDPQ